MPLPLLEELYMELEERVDAERRTMWGRSAAEGATESKEELDEELERELGLGTMRSGTSLAGGGDEDLQSGAWEMLAVLERTAIREGAL
jgi:hypothetical protein